MLADRAVTGKETESVTIKIHFAFRDETGGQYEPAFNALTLQAVIAKQIVENITSVH